MPPEKTIGEQISPDGMVLDQQPDIAVPDAPPEVTTPEVTPEAEPEVTPEATKTEETPAKLETTPEDDNVLDLFKKVKDENDPTITKPTTEVAKPKVASRDYTGLEEAAIPLFKAMSNEAFNRLKPIYLEHKELQTKLKDRDTSIAEMQKNRLPENYYTHPDGYILDPEFATLSQTANTASQILNHWESQLEAVRTGAAEYEHIELNKQTGQFEVTKLPADAKAEIKLMRYLGHAQNQASAFQSKLQEFATTFKQKHAELNGWVNNFENNAFPLFAKPEIVEKFKPVIDDTIRLLPVGLRNSPLAGALAKSMVVNQYYHNIISKMQADGKLPAAGKVQTKQVSATDKRKAGPTDSDAGSTAGSGNSSKEVTFEDFQRVKEGW